MQKQITVIYDENNPNEVRVESDPSGECNPWDDLALLMEGVGVLIQICRNNGIHEHNGMSVTDYLKKYIHQVSSDYKAKRIVN